MAGDPAIWSGFLCDRAREWAALKPDGELSELELGLLRRHLAECAACREFDARVTAATEVVRATPFEQPARRVELPAPAASPRRRRLALGAVAAAAVLGSVVGIVADGQAPTPEPTPTQISFLTRDLDQLREIPRGRSFFPTPPAREPGFPPEGIV